MKRMPVHDWTRVTAGTFHDLHVAWIGQLRHALNGGLLPDNYYAMAEQVAGQSIPDVLTLEEVGGHPAPASSTPTPDIDDEGGIALAAAPPKVSQIDTVSEAVLLAARRKRIVIRHSRGDRVVALLELVSPGNKHKPAALENFVDKAVGALAEGYHLMVVDLFPPGASDPQGMHGAIWRRLNGSFDPPQGKPLTLASYRAARDVTCYVEAMCVGAKLIDMPLFLDPDHYINVPLEKTYMEAYADTPRRWKAVLEQA